MNDFKLFTRILSIGFLLGILKFHELLALNNGLARLPPMGWSTWNAFGCKKCDNSYDINCLSENAIRNVADILEREGYSRLGYEFIIIDDCWQNKYRDVQQLKLQPDPIAFPRGMKALAKYVHDKNLKLGIFSDLSPETGGKYPGTHGRKYLELDAQTFAEWDVDYVKMSAFQYPFPNYLENDYIDFGDFLRRTHRNIVYATSWPFFEENAGHQVDYRTVAAHCNTWRFSGDSVASWKNILDIMDLYASKQTKLRVAHFGAWNDADLLLAGNDGVTLDQAKAQMAVWSIMPSSLIFSVDLYTLKPETRSLLQNSNVINVNQDSLGLPGYRLPKNNRDAFSGYQHDVDVWLRPIMPTVNGYHSFAVAFVNRNAFYAADFSVTLQSMGLTNPEGYNMIDLFPSSSGPSVQVMFPSTTLYARINPTGVVMYKAEARRGSADVGTDRTARQHFIPSDQIIRYRTYDYWK